MSDSSLVSMNRGLQNDDLIMRIAIDTGGTFTDCVVLEGSRVKILKIFSTPEDSAAAILEGVQRLAQDSPGVGAVDVIHGTTVGTNSLLERRGARVALITTAGFEDLIEIGRQNRPRLYDLNVRREPPVVPRSMRWGVKERTTAGGEILLRPQARDLRRLCSSIKRAGAESVAICFLFSFRNPRNEQLVGSAVLRLGLPVSVSNEILPEFREYERLSTVVINAYLAPRLGTYLDRLAWRVGSGFLGHSSQAKHDQNAALTSAEAPVAERAFGHIYVMQSSGGITTAARAAREPVRTILSGPAGGVVASARLAKILGIQRAMSFDMGGTSTDVCLLDGPPRTTHETTLAGLPVAVPVLDVHSVGAGGGSMARVDGGGALRVGPESAGAVPGPICYGRGGVRPTVTDAHLLLGRLDPDYFLGGTFSLDSRKVEQRFTEFLRRTPAKFRALIPGSALALADGIVAVSNATMERALRLISVERGYDPRDFTLICFGGAGGLHAADLARALGLAGVIVPLYPGAFSALGILLSDVVRDASQSVLMTVPLMEEANRKRGPARAEFQKLIKSVGRRFQAIEREAITELRHDHFEVGRMRIERRLAVRYIGQAYELSIPFTPQFPDRFHAEHEIAYGHAQPQQPVEIVSLQVRLVLPTPKPRSATKAIVHNEDAREAIVKRKLVCFGRHYVQTSLYDRQRLKPGARFAGPAIVVEYSSTTVVPSGFTCRVDEHSNLRVTQNGD